MKASSLLLLVLVGDANTRVPFLGIDGAVGAKACLDIRSVQDGGPAARAGLMAGDCIRRARVKPEQWGEYCAAMKEARAGDSLEVELADGGVRSIVLGNCANAVFDVNVQLQGSPLELDVPRTTTVGELRTKLRVDGPCSIRSGGACGEAAVSIAEVPDSYRLDAHCHVSYLLRCESQPRDDRVSATLIMPSGATLNMRLHPGEKPPAELRCVPKKLEPNVYDCAGKRRSPAPSP